MLNDDRENTDAPRLKVKRVCRGQLILDPLAPNGSRGQQNKNVVARPNRVPHHLGYRVPRLKLELVEPYAHAPRAQSFHYHASDGLIVEGVADEQFGQCLLTIHNNVLYLTYYILR